MNAPATTRRGALRCAARHLGHATRGVWCDRCATDAEQLLGVVRGVLTHPHGPLFARCEASR